MLQLNPFDCVRGSIFEEYFYLHGLSSLLGAKCYVLSPALEEVPHEPLLCHHVVLNVLKVLSYATIVIPIFMLLGRNHYRQSLIPAVAPQLEPSQPRSPKVTVGTYNVLFPQRLPPSRFSTPIGYSRGAGGSLYSNTDFRIKVIRDNILKSNLDILCLQEVTAEMLEQLSVLKRKYHISFQPHALGAHGVAILYNKSLFECVGQRTFSSTIPVPKNHGGGTFLKKRMHVLVDLKSLDTQKIYRVVSCHLVDPRDLPSQLKTRQVHKIVKEAQRSTGPRIDKIIIAGDMNQDQFGDAEDCHKPRIANPVRATIFKYLMGKGFYPDSNLNSSEYEKEAFDNGPIISKNRRIDWILTSKRAPTHLPLPHFDKRGSDHRLVAVTV